MKIEGIKGCYEKTRGIFYFARMCSKIRLHEQGKLPPEYHEMGQGFDGRTCRYLSVRYEDVKAHVLAGHTDEAVLDWCFAHGHGLTDEQVLIYNSFMSKRGWRDDETDVHPRHDQALRTQGRRQRPHRLRSHRNR